MKPRSEWKQIKRSPLPPRTSWLKSSAKPIARSAKPRAVNRQRKSREFARTYHSPERVVFVKALGCVYCTALSPFFGIASAGKSHNAHVGSEGAGASRKANYDQIVPLCALHHRRYDERLFPLDAEPVREAIRSTMVEVERRWQAHRADAGAEP